MRWVQLSLLCAAFILIEALIGGTRLVFSLPSCGLLALAALLGVFSKQESQRPAHGECLIATGIFMGIIAVRAWFSPVEYLARADLALAFGALLVYLLIALDLTRTRQRLIVVFVLFAIALAQVALGGWQHFRGERLALFGVLEPEDFGLRASGFYICPNHLAGFLQVTLLLGLGIACWSRRAVWMRVLAMFVAVASLFGIALTGSRGGFLSALAGVAVFGGLSLLVLRSAGRRGWAAAIVGLAVAGMIAGGFALILNHQRALQVRAAKLLPKDDLRLDLWRAAWQQAQLQPVTGTGSGTYQFYARQFRPARVQADPVHAHNDYLQLLAEYGALGLIAGFAFLALHAWRGIRTLRERLQEQFLRDALPQSDRLALTIGALAAVAACAFHSFVDFNLHVPANAMLLAFVFGLLANPGGAPGKSASSANRVGFGARFALPAVALWFGAMALPTLPAEFQGEQSRLALRTERYSDCIAAAREGLAWDEKNPFLWLYLGQAHASQAEMNTDKATAQVHFKTAAEAFEHGLRLYPQEQWLLVGMAQALDGLERFAEAEPIYQRAIEWNPTSAAMRYFYGAHLSLAGRFADAEAEFRKSLQLWNNPAAQRGMELLAQTREAPAER